MPSVKCIDVQAVHGLTLRSERSMVKTYNLYIPGPYENFAEQATEEWNSDQSRNIKKRRYISILVSKVDMLSFSGFLWYVMSVWTRLSLIYQQPSAGTHWKERSRCRPRQEIESEGAKAEKKWNMKSTWIIMNPQICSTSTKHKLPLCWSKSCPVWLCFWAVLCPTLSFLKVEKWGK